MSLSSGVAGAFCARLQNRKSAPPCCGIRTFPLDISPGLPPVNMLMYAKITVRSPTSIYDQQCFHQSRFHLNKERVTCTSNVRVNYVSFWTGFVVISRFRYTTKISFIRSAYSYQRIVSSNELLPHRYCLISPVSI